MSVLPVHLLAHPELQIKELRMKDERKEERKEGRWSWKEVGEEGSVEEGGRGKEGVKDKRGITYIHVHTHTHFGC